MRNRIAIIGAGLSGALLAKTLHARADVTLFDKSQGAGGRLSTRRAEVNGYTFYFDHGAPFFHVNSVAFANVLSPFLELGAVEAWPFGGDGAYVACPKMTALPKALIGDMCFVTQTQIVQMYKNAQNTWNIIDSTHKEHGPFDQIVLAMPAPQAVDLLPCAFAHYTAVKNIKMRPCWVLMLGFAPDEGLPKWGVHSVLDAACPIRRIVANHKKPGRNADVLTFVAYSRFDWAEQNIDICSETAKKSLMDVTLPFLGSDDVPQPLYAQTHRWLYGDAKVTVKRTCVYADRALGLAACGDWAGGSGGAGGAVASALALLESGFFDV